MVAHPPSCYPNYRATCVFCENVYGACHCHFPESGDPDADGFEWSGHWIVEPNVSACGRYFVDPVAYYGAAYTAWRAAKLARGETLIERCHTLDALSAEYAAWQASRGLSLGSADEVDTDTLSPADRAWLREFCLCWDLAVKLTEKGTP